MLSVKALPERHRMDIVSDVPLGPQEVADLIDKIGVEARMLRPGWIAAVDFRGMWVDSSFVNEQFRRLQDALLGLGAARIGTLLDSDPLKMRLWQSGSQTRSNEITQRFHDEAAWEAFLSQPRSA
jgi:hypothetical protein